MYIILCEIKLQYNSTILFYYIKPIPITTLKISVRNKDRNNS